jgi:hypothetical protein
MKKLLNQLKIYLKDNKIVDIFIIGSAIKDKLEPGDIDIILLLREKDIKENNELMYQIKKSISFENIHIEPLLIDEMQTSKIFPAIIHEGYSIANNKMVSELINYVPFSLFIFSLKKLNKIEKVKFAQAIYGRKNKGLLTEEKGFQVGKGAIAVPVKKEELFKELFNKFKVSFSVKRILMNN